MWTVGPGPAAWVPTRPGSAWRRRRKASLPSASALASYLGVTKQYSSRARPRAPGRVPGSGLLSEAISSPDSGQLPPSNGEQRAPPRGELRRGVHMGVCHPGQLDDQGKLREEGQTFHKAERVCSSCNEELDIVASAGSGLELPTQTGPRQRARLSFGPTA